MLGLAVGTAVATNVLPNPITKENTNNTTNTSNKNVSNETINNSNNTTTDGNEDTDTASDSNSRQKTNLENNPDYEKLSSDEYVAEWDEATHKHDGSDFRIDQPYRYDDEGNIHIRRYNQDTGENYWS
ncbi:hypothetical protein [Methanobrevibacter boviskoreani]|uniref:hypothetical protein n=1 Tax=Methanobrevibacter boviskoreani TaxID=1348249 RepID=UPI0023A8571E|nr:hypothetical protein [Methanobrevibacter boviskoreani]MCI6774842.1 hypothetical protein [Methanobrevibacter boviskoreani]